MGKERKKKEEEIKAADHLFRTLPSYFHVNEALTKEHWAFKTTVVWVFRGMGKRWVKEGIHCTMIKIPTLPNKVTKNNSHHNDKRLESAKVAVKASCCYAFVQNVD